MFFGPYSNLKFIIFTYDVVYLYDIKLTY